MRLEIVDQHHEVLTAWAEYRKELPEAPWALTLDHHTDTLPAFGRIAADESERQARIARVDFRDSASVAAAIASLRHDEHLDLALRSGILTRSVVVAHFDNPGCANAQIQVVSDRSWPPLCELLNDSARFRPLADSVLEDSFLEERLAEAGFVPEEHRGFILDVDLDYFLTRRAVKPLHDRMWRRLFASAGLVTLSREEVWQRLLRLEKEVDVEFLCMEIELFCTEILKKHDFYLQ